MMSRKTLIIVLLVVLLLAGGGYGYYKFFYQPEEVAAVSTVQTSRVRQGDLIIYASGSGTLIVGEEMELGLPEGDYETVAGFVLHLLGHIPKTNEKLRYQGMKLVITEMRGLKIEKILLTKEKRDTTSQQGVAEDKKGNQKNKHE